MIKLGAHVSAAGGCFKIFQRGADLGCECLQLFTRAPSRWEAKPLSEEMVSKFRSERSRFPSQSVIAHDIYLNNLASERDDLRQRSIETMVEELERCHTLGIDGLVCHLGAHSGGPESGLPRYSEAVREILQRTEEFPTPILLETCAGQGSCLGHRLEHLAHIIEHNDSHERLGVCVDTCHIFVAGYDLSTSSSYQQFWGNFEELIGLERLKALHLNDSKKPLGSRVDRHHHIGLGEMGEFPFASIVNDPRFEGIPAIIETPELATMAETNLKVLKALRTA